MTLPRTPASSVGPARRSPVGSSAVSPGTRTARGEARGRPCSRPGCASLASATMSYDYGARILFVGRLTEESSPHWYDLCSAHAGGLVAPRGWAMHAEPWLASAG